jgi:proline iminopeptidase
VPVVRLNDTELFYAEVGEGLPCLMMHGGLGFDHTYLHPWLDPLGDVMRLVYYDHRGNGRSGRPPWETLTFEQLCADADALREHLGFEKVSVMGHSLGGIIALEYALRYPERLECLILLDTAPSLDYWEDEVEENARRKGATPEQLEALSADQEDNEEFVRAWKLIEPLYFQAYEPALAERALANTVFSVEANNAQASFLEGWDVTPRLGEIGAATLVVVGRDDIICPPSQARRLHDGIPYSNLIVIEQSGHFLWLEEPEAFFGAVREWFRGTR